MTICENFDNKIFECEIVDRELPGTKIITFSYKKWHIRQFYIRRFHIRRFLSLNMSNFKASNVNSTKILHFLIKQQKQLT